MPRYKTGYHSVAADLQVCEPQTKCMWTGRPGGLPPRTPRSINETLALSSVSVTCHSTQVVFFCTL
jgi:hypothetical protein